MVSGYLLEHFVVEFAGGPQSDISVNEAFDEGECH